jgi:hypothetical protein
MRKVKQGVSVGSDGLTAVQRWVKLHPEEHRASRRKHTQRLRLAVLALLGSRCSNSECRWLNSDGTFGCTDIDLLQIDHINGGGSKEQRELGRTENIRRKILQMKNPETEYQILCANCNWKKRYTNKEVTGPDYAKLG